MTAPLSVVVGGASGFLGSALVSHLRGQGHQVTRLVRSGPVSDDASLWDPAEGRIDQIVVDRADAVVNLSGASIARWPRTASYRRELVRSRVDPTRTLARAVAASSTPTVFLSGSAMGVYGPDRDDEVLDEHSLSGEGFVPQLVEQWESAAQAAQQAGARVCLLRTSLVMDSSGGMLQPLLPMFRLGLGARLGSGRQYMSFVSLTDWVRAVAFCLETEVSGPVNLASPEPVRNSAFTDALGDAVNRPTVLVAPAPVLRLALRGIADDLIGSLRLDPAVLREAGFVFQHPDIDSTLAAGIG